MINPKKELWIWGPMDGRPIYTSYFMIAMVDHLPRYYKYSWPESLFYFIKGRMTFISDNKDIRNAGKKHFNTWIMNNKNLKKARTDYKINLSKLKQLQSRFSEKFLSSLNDNVFAATFIRWHKLYLDFWGVGLVPELANLGGEEILKELVYKQIDNKKEARIAFEKLSAPESISFYQEEELALLELKKIKNKKRFEKLIKKHAEKYFWIRNSYFEQKQLGIDYFKKILAGIEEADKNIDEIKNLPEKTISEKRAIIKKYNLDKKTQKTAKKLSFSVWWQDSRKKEIFIANHYIDMFLKEISKRKKIKFLDLKFYWPTEIIRLLKNNKKVPLKVISERKKFVLASSLNGVLGYECGKKEKEIVRPFLERKVVKEPESITGMVVSTGCGKAEGKVKILLTPRNVNKIEQGDVLVAPMTSPEYIFAMKKASAIVTDEGGMTCHAAVVSRELGIPCIVGTKIATKILKDGMLVEVNANHGVVRKIR